MGPDPADEVFVELARFARGAGTSRRNRRTWRAELERLAQASDKSDELIRREIEANKAPASTRFTVELSADGSRLGAFSTGDGQINLVLSEGAVPPRSGQTGVWTVVQAWLRSTPAPRSSGWWSSPTSSRARAR